MSEAHVGREPLFDTLEIIEDFEPHDGTFNMALDEVLLGQLGATPVLRVYRWNARTVSFGYFEPVAPVRVAYAGWPLVRRWTGGGIVEHGGDATYSLFVPPSHPFAGRPVADTYRLVHEAVARALAHVGWGEVVLSGERTGGVGEGSHACFAAPVRHDLMCGGRKVAGAAQRRTRHGLLHQGSIHGPGSGMDGKTSADVLEAPLAEAFGASRETRGLRSAEAAAAQNLALTRYGTDAWLHRF